MHKWLTCRHAMHIFNLGRPTLYIGLTTHCGNVLCMTEEWGGMIALACSLLSLDIRQ